jgi:inosine-uridine nucleoside N-ribohydrolase
MNKIHLDTDLGGDIDDLCALALLLRWPGGVELTGITTVSGQTSQRAGYVKYVLALERRGDIPVAAGADVSKGCNRYEIELPPEARYWPEPVLPYPTSLDAALHLLKVSIEQGAAIIGIGPFTNLYLLDLRYPGILKQARLFLMGGYLYPPRPGYPQWGNDFDFNVQADIKAAKHVLQHSSPTLVTLSVTAETALRRSHLDILRHSGALGGLITHQAEAFIEDEQIAIRYIDTCNRLPADIINFQHDALACAIACGWEGGVEIQETRIVVEEKAGWLTEHIQSEGSLFRIVTQVDGPRFNQYWIDAIAGR